MLYSPLYQSIRLVLFGALGLSSLTVSTAINQIDLLTPEPLITDSSNYYAADANTDVNSKINPDISYQSDNQQAENASSSSDTTLDTDALKNSNVNITEINERTTTSQNGRAAPVNANSISKANSRRIDTNDESIQESLKRLAEFYELTPDTNVATANDMQSTLYTSNK